MCKQIKYMLVVSVLLLCGWWHADAGTPQLISFQGFLADSAGPAANQAAAIDCIEILCNADFSTDAVDGLPDSTLPGLPNFDSLNLYTTYGEITVRSAMGSLVSKPVELSPDPSHGVTMRAFPKPYEHCDSFIVSWRSLVRIADFKYCRTRIFSSDGHLIAALEYRGDYTLTYNDADSILPVTYDSDSDNLFEIVVNFLTSTTSVFIDGVPMTGFDNVPFIDPAAIDIGYVDFVAQYADYVVDDITICSFCEPSFPDLIVSYFVINGGVDVYQLEDISQRVDLTIMNIGNAPSVPCVGSIRLSSDSSISPDDSLLGGLYDIPALDPGDTVTIEFDDPIYIPEDWPAGPAWLFATADEEDVIIELAEDNNDEEMVVTVIVRCYERTLTILDCMGEPIANHVVSVYTVENNPPIMSETEVGFFTTDANGEIAVSLCNGDMVKVVAHSHDYESPPHNSTFPEKIYHYFVDNAEFDYATGAISYDMVSSVLTQTIQLNHSDIRYNMLISIEWDATPTYLQSLVDNLRQLSIYYHDVFNGQGRFFSINVFDNKENWRIADMRIYADNRTWPTAWLTSWKHWERRGWHSIQMPPKFCGGNGRTRKCNREQDPLNLEDYNDYSAKAHELGHYYFGFGDEYMDKNGTYLTHSDNFGLMENPGWLVEVTPGSFRLHEQSSELSRLDVEYHSSSDRNTDHWDLRHESCADYWKEKNEGYHNFHRCITRPEDYLPDKILLGPSDHSYALNWDVGQLMWVITNDNNTGAYRQLCCWHLHDLPASPANSVVYLTGNYGSLSIGNPADDGCIYLLGYHPGDEVHVYQPFEVIGGGHHKSGSNFGWCYFEGVPDDSGDFLYAALDSVSGALPFIHHLSATPNSVQCNLVVQNHPLAAPIMELKTMDDIYSDIQPTVQNGNVYSAVFADDTAFNEGLLITSVIDSAGDPYNIYNDCRYSSLLDHEPRAYIGGAGGRCELKLDSLNTVDRDIFSLSSNYPPLLDGLRENAIWAGEVFSWTFVDVEPMVGTNVLIMHFDPTIFGDTVFGYTISTDYIMQNLKIFRWNESMNEWNQIGGSVDTIRYSVNTLITEPGAYTAFLLFPSAIDCGDANSDAGVNIGDAVHLINYIFKGGPAPDPLCVGDADGDDAVNIGDAVYLINYIFKGGPAPVEDCCP